MSHSRYLYEGILRGTGAGAPTKRDPSLLEILDFGPSKECGTAIPHLFAGRVT